MFTNFLIFIVCISLFPKSQSSHLFLQAIHVLDPSIDEFKYFESWNSDQWIQWVRNRYIEDLESRRFYDEGEPEVMNHPLPPLYGLWVNLIIIGSTDEINSAFSESSNRSYTDDENKSDFLWSDVPFSVFAVVRQGNKADGNEEIKERSYKVFSCAQKKMYINAKVDEDFNPILIQNLFPKKVKNPKETLRIPLIACSSVGQKRNLLDEIKFQLKS